MKTVECLLTKWALRHFPLTFNKKTWNETFIYREKNRSKFKRFINVGLTIYKDFLLRCLYYCCIFDYSHVYKGNIQHVVVGD